MDEFLLIPILVVLGNYRKHKITQFYTAPTFIPWPRRMLIMFKTSFKYFKSRICGELLMKQQVHNDHVGQKKCPVVDTWWQWFPGGIGCSSCICYIQNRTFRAVIDGYW
jgi:acyl-coenzyme A synthetase/AMP-(fatty) acid ligase